MVAGEEVRDVFVFRGMGQGGDERRWGLGGTGW